MQYQFQVTGMTCGHCERAVVHAVRELDEEAMVKVDLPTGQVVVESRRVAATEAGDVIRAVADGTLRPQDLVTMHELFTGVVSPAGDRPRIVKTCGMGWQDLAVAARAVRTRQA